MSEKCQECQGTGKIVCPVCKGTRVMPFKNQLCSYCVAGKVKCPSCDGRKIIDNSN